MYLLVGLPIYGNWWRNKSSGTENI